MQKKRKRRSIKERIADGERELAELRVLERIQKLEEALKEGHVANGSRTEFTTQLRELRLIQKTVAAAERHDQTQLVEPLKEFLDRLAESMALLVDEG